jgi:uncharacterized protein (TIGR00369 family)
MTQITTPPFVDHVGIHHTDGSAECVSAEVRLSPHLLNRSGTAHGGLIATLLDTTMGRVALLACGGEGRIATVEMKVTFINPGRGTLRGSAWCTHRDKRVFCEGEVRDEPGLLVARGSASFKHWPPAGDA